MLKLLAGVSCSAIVGAFPRCIGVGEEAHMQQSSGGVNSGTGSGTSAAQVSSDDADLALRRMDKIREKNRRAQAKHREKVKV